jgi:hypothetical protein
MPAVSDRTASRFTLGLGTDGSSSVASRGPWMRRRWILVTGRMNRRVDLLGPQRHLQDLGQVEGMAAARLGDLLAAAEAVGD